MKSNQKTNRTKCRQVNKKRTIIQRTNHDPTGAKKSKASVESKNNEESNYWLNSMWTRIQRNSEESEELTKTTVPEETENIY